MIKKIINDVKTILDFVKSDKKIMVVSLIMAVSVLLMVVGKLGGNKPENTDIPDTPSYNIKKANQVVWEEVEAIPGTTNYADVKDKIEGTPKTGSIFKGLTIYNYTNIGAQRVTTEVAATREGTIKYVFFNLYPLNMPNLESYITKYDLETPDVIKDIDGIANHSAYVYLDKGLMLYVGKETQKVRSEMFFEPTTKAKFEELWGSKLTDEHSFPEDIVN